MFKIRIIRNCRLATLNENKDEIIRNCIKGEDVFISKLNSADIRDKLYAPYKQQIDSKRVRERQYDNLPVQQSNNTQEQIQSAVSLLNEAVVNAANLIKILGNANKEVTENIENLKIQPAYLKN